MTEIRQHDVRIREWLEPGPTEAPGDLVEAILAEVPAIRQRHRWEVAPRLELGGRTRLVLAAGLTLILLAGLIAVGVFVAGRRPAPLLFNRVPDVSAFAGGSVADVTVWRGQLLAVGSVADAGHTVGTVWTSAAGINWARVTPGSATVDVRIARVATNGRTIVAIGYICAPGPGYCGQPTLLSSVDGRTWRPATIVGSETLALAGLVARDSGFAAVGSRGDETSIGAVAATSADGSAWSVTASDVPPFAGGSMAGVADGPAGLVAVGTSSGRPAAWRSTDGLSWTEVEVPSRSSDAGVDDVAGGNGRYVAVGHVASQGGAWTSVDGQTWTAQPGSPALDSARMTRVVWTGQEFLAFGTSSAGNGLAWMSADGASWTRLDTGEIFAGGSIDAGGRIGPVLELFGASSAGEPVVAISSR